MEEQLTGERLAVLEVHLLAAAGVRWWQQQGRPMNRSMINQWKREWLAGGWWLAEMSAACYALVFFLSHYH